MRVSSLALFAAMLAIGGCGTASYDLEEAARSVAPAPAATADAAEVRSSGRTLRYGDNDPHDWVGRAPHVYPVHGTDVSKFQKTIDWQEKRAAGIAFSFIKATEGGDLLDTRFMENWNAAKRAGIPRGAYHFFYFCRPAFEQARWFIRNVPRDRSSLPPVLDMEWNHKSPTCKYRPPADAVRKEMSVFLKQVERHYGKKPIIYTTVDFYRDNELWKFQDYPYWLRSVAGHPSKVYKGQRWKFWQYTGTGIMPGVGGDTDINVFGGTRAEWRDWLAKNTK